MKTSNFRRLEAIKDFSFALPALLFMMIFIYYPLLNSLYLSFTNWNMTRPVKKFVGADNYTYLLTNELFYKVLKVTFTYTILDVTLTLAIGLLLALLFNVTSRAFNFMRSVIFMPYYISMVIVSMIFLWIFNGQFGLANEVMAMFGVEPINWLTNTKTAIWVLVIVSVWKGVGFAMIIFIAGLRGIPVEYYEASSIDGANKWWQFWQITLPLLSPITLFLVVTNFISSMQVFQSVDIMTNGGPLDSTKAMVYWIYDMAFAEFRTGRASALVIIFFVIIVLFTMLQMYVSRKKVHYEG
ncbi:sn-glycerol 3-phosphate transport system permease protein [Paenibacillus sp. UNCCL117]|uniref:carbohydrate ABC transporter permease n=1 Tax=unclassified Paenibacillus TaxID=185978 RepID=UPI00088D8F20|nr:MULTISPECIES: sugar ABC transporter permease [unclassified Paenibacillus]SDD82452.1 carbohydrate ABC transporter membrane protein 1, CUT1 family [Paenibacillus sp. cl123]SFW55147.1 sn-glycerol 3-phosphate transport system permease protein [Paenibacillus sp. UNCCL117]